MTCQWEFDSSCIGGDAAVAAIDPALWDRSLTLATSTLQMLTKYRVGLCPITIRPVYEPMLCGCTFNPHLESDGLWYNSCVHRPGWLTPLGSIDIPGPVGKIVQFTISGEDVDLNDGNWGFVDGHILMWQGDGPSPVPATQDINQPIDAPGSWAITYSQSYPVQVDGQVAVALLALEYVEACKPRGKCRLPRGVTNVVRNGVTFTVDAGLFINGLTGIEIVDAFITKWAPADSPAVSATVFNPRGVNRNRVVGQMPFS